MRPARPHRTRTSRFAACLALVAAGLTFAAPRAARAEESADSLFARGNEAYLHGDFKTAIDAYEQAITSGAVSEDLHYNLANAYVKADRLGPAAHHYELALAIDPSQEDARANLKLVREEAGKRWQDKLLGEEKDPLWARALHEFTPGSLTLLFLGLYVTLFALALAVHLLPSGFARVSLMALLGFFALGALSTGGLLFARFWVSHRIEQAIVLPDELAVKEGPDGNYQTSFLVHASLRLRILEHDGDWVKIRLPNGLEGWTRERDVGKL